MAISVFDGFSTPVASGLGTAETGQEWSIIFGDGWAVNSDSAIWTWDPSDPGGPNNNATLAVIESNLVGGKTSATLVNVESMPTFANGVGIVVRYVDINFFWQCLLYKFFADSRIRLQRTYAGVGPTTVLDIDIPGSLSNMDVLSVGYCGDDFEVFVNDVSLGTYNASAAPQNYGTKSGLITQTGSAFATYNQRWDDFTVETLGTCSPTYNCEDGACVDPGDGSGMFATLAACQANCDVPVSYNCVDGVCVDPGDGSGEFATLEQCQQAPCGGTIEDAVKTMGFDEGTGSSYYLIPPVTDSGDELRSKVIKSMRSTGRRTNASIKAYGYDVNREVDAGELEAGENASTRAQALPDSESVAQSPRKQINVPNAVLHTVRIEGDDTGQDERDEIHEIVVEVAKQGVRR